MLASGLSIPWGIAALPDGAALVTERDSGRIWRVKPGAKATVVYTVTETRPAGEGGLLGITLAPDFARSRAFFIYYTTATDNRVARVVLGSTARPKPIVTGIPKGTIHNGGGLFYKAGSGLFIGTGDTGNRDLAQNTKSLGGKVLKVSATGAAVRGNRWGRVVSIGHRNVQDLDGRSRRYPDVGVRARPGHPGRGQPHLQRGQLRLADLRGPLRPSRFQGPGVDLAARGSVALRHHLGAHPGRRPVLRRCPARAAGVAADHLR